jgi:hypothetical protein
MQGPSHAAQPPATAPPPPPPPAAVDTVTLEYQTGWSRAFLHFNADGRGAGPGARLLLFVAG